MRLVWMTIAVMSLVGCQSDPEPGEQEDVLLVADLVEPSATCPDMSESGTLQINSAGLDREFILHVPEDAEPGMPVLFVFHGVGDTGGYYIDSGLDLDRMAEQEQAVIVTPAASGSFMFEWDFLNDGADDLALYDDLRTCLSRELEVDLHRFYATGMSAGGLWTTFLAIHRADTLATVLTWSGGAEPLVTYQPLAADIPVLVAWGGPDDTWGASGFVVEFEEATMALSEHLQDDGHFVVECNHGAGHTIPMDGRGVMTDWLFAHEVGEPSPFADGDLSDLPSYCETASGSTP